MAVAERLSDAEIDTRLLQLNESTAQPWTLESAKLSKTFVFADFVVAFAFMTRIALVAERMNHHPEWFNVYRTVRVALTTHDADGISVLDFELATAMEAAAGTLL